MIKLERQGCLRCGYSWIPRKEIIRVCPRCKSPYWDKELARKRRSKR